MLQHIIINIRKGEIMKKEDFKVGQIAWLRSNKYLAKRKHDSEVLKVYVKNMDDELITVGEVGADDKWDISFEINNNFAERTNRVSAYTLYLNEQDVLDAIEKDELYFNIRLRLEYGRRSTKLDTLRKIKNIMDEVCEY